MSVLAQKNILVGVTGGIAAYKIPLLIMQLIKLNCNVKVVMTPSSKEFVTPLTLSTVSKNDVHSEFSTKKNGNPTWNNHVELSEWADIFIIAPATSNSISLAFHTASAFSAGIIPILAIASQACASISYHILNFVLGDHISTISGRE